MSIKHNSMLTGVIQSFLDVIKNPDTADNVKIDLSGLVSDLVDKQYDNISKEVESFKFDEEKKVYINMMEDKLSVIDHQVKTLTKEIEDAKEFSIVNDSESESEPDNEPSKSIDLENKLCQKIQEQSNLRYYIDNLYYPQMFKELSYKINTDNKINTLNNKMIDVETNIVNTSNEINDLTAKVSNIEYDTINLYDKIEETRNVLCDDVEKNRYDIKVSQDENTFVYEQINEMNEKINETQSVFKSEINNNISKLQQDIENKTKEIIPGISGGTLGFTEIESKSTGWTSPIAVDEMSRNNIHLPVKPKIVSRQSQWTLSTPVGFCDPDKMV